MDSHLYVTDGGRNGVWDVDLASGVHSLLATFPTIPNPLPVGGPVIEAVPTGIEYVDGRLLVTLFRGVPFASGSSSVVEIDKTSGAWSMFIGGLKTAIDVLPIGGGYLVLQNSSGPLPFFAGPGVVPVDQRSGSATGDDRELPGQADVDAARRRAHALCRGTADGPHRRVDAAVTCVRRAERRDPFLILVR